jgi:hypothetical protein
MRRRVLIHAACVAVFISLLCVACQPRYGEGWERVSEGGLTVMMPGKPRMTHEGNSTTYVLNHNGEILTASYDLMIAPPPGQEQRALDAVRNSFVMSVGGKLIGEREISPGGAAGREMTVDDPRHGQVITHRVYLVKSILYQVGASADKGKELSGDSRKFLDSVDIRGR